MKTETQRFNIRRYNPGPHNEMGDDFTYNVYAYIEGNDPELKNEIIVIGAHLDHIGYGPSMSRSNQIAIHNGADDNASGSVCLMEVAKAFSMLEPQPRTIVFQWYSAEEMGLIGSRYYCDNPTFPKDDPDISSHISMINLDMVGRLGGGIQSVGFFSGESSVDINRYIRELNDSYPFSSNITSTTGGGSDHAPFYNKRIPVAFLHTGIHQDYHTPSDDIDKINFTGMEKISKYTFELAYKIMHHTERPQFNHASFKKMDYVHDHGHGEEFLHNHEHGDH